MKTQTLPRKNSDNSRHATRAMAAPVAKLTPANMSELVVMFNAGRYTELESCAHALLELHPKSGFIWKVLGAALQMQGKAALFALREAARLLPDDAEAHNNLGAALRDHRQAEAALDCYRRALALRPTYPEALNNRGIAQLDLGSAHDAVASFRQALKINPKYAQAHNNAGNALQALGQLDGAVDHYRKALTLQPRYAEAHNNLGKALHDLKQLDAALASYQLALDNSPNYVDAHSNMAVVLQELGQSEAAVASCRRALGLNPNYAEAHSNMAIALQELGQFDAALASFRRALEINPALADAHNNLANALCELRQLDAAAACCLRTLEIRPKFAEAFVALGYVRRLQGRTADAVACCENALAINSDLDGAVLFLAELQVDQGQFALAEKAFWHVISLKPESPQAWAGIARVRKMTQSDTAWLTGALNVAESGLVPRQEVFLRYAIGKYFDDTKDFDQAFLNYRRANELTKLYGRKYDPERQTLIVDLATRVYDREWSERQRSNANASKRPVFIVGMPRSGTSLAEQILASHPAVHGAGELPYWRTASMQHDMSVLKGEDSDQVLERLAADYLQSLKGISADALRVVDKMPGNFLYLGLILAAFPDARIIHMQRNPVDTCLSIYFQHFNTTHIYANDLEDLAHYYTEYFRLMDHWRLTLPNSAILHVPYEELVDDQEVWSRKMLDFIGMPWDARCLDFDQCERTVSTISNWQVRQKITKSSVERWRNYADYAGPLMRLLELGCVVEPKQEAEPTMQLLGDILRRMEKSGFAEMEESDAYMFEATKVRARREAGMRLATK